MNALRRALSAEALKLRGTLALWMCVIAPASVVAMVVLQLTFTEIKNPPAYPADEAWMRFAHGVLALWTFLMLPLFVTLQAALLAGLEHANQQWKHLLALPLPRGAHYLAKLLALAAMVLLAMTLLLLLIVLGGGLLGLLQPEFGIAGAPPWTFLLTRIPAIFAAALLIIAMHNWIAIRWRSFTVAVSIGMTATVAGFLIGQSKNFGHLYPWSLPLQVLAGDGGRLQYAVLAGLLGGALVAALGLADFLRREMD